MSAAESGTEDATWPTEVNGHSVIQTKPADIPPMPLGDGTETDPNTAFKCLRCGHTMVPPRNRVEDHEWVQNAFDCVPCDDSATEGSD